MTQQPDTAQSTRILIVCLGNHCRSPLAATVLAHRGAGAIDVRSAGLAGHHVDRPAHPMMIAAAAQRGYDLTAHRGIRLTADLFAWADLVLAMDQAVLEQVRHQARRVDTVFKLRRYLSDADVPDPWGKPSGDFAACAALIDTGASQHLPVSQHRTAGGTGR